MDELTVLQDTAIANLKQEMLTWVPVTCPLDHLFTPGMYVRRIFMPAFDEEGRQTVVVSKKHKTTHPYYIEQGRVKVFNTEESFLKDISAPYLGVTLTGTQRVLLIMEDTFWYTWHVVPFVTGEENDLPEEEKQEFVKKVEIFLVGEEVKWPS